MSDTHVLRLTAFSDDPEGGNPAGVVLNASGLSDAEMLSIAHEVGYSETAFLTPHTDVENSYQIRYFTPEAEVAFCGHATIASGVVLGREYGDGVYELSTNAGPVEVDVTVAGQDVVATLTSPPASVQPLEHDLLYDLLDALDWDESVLDTRFTPAVGFVGNAHPIVVLDSRETLASMDYDFDVLGDLMKEHGWTTIQLVYPDEGDPHGRRWHSRNPAPSVGIYEDPATGSAAAALGAYFRDTGIYGTGDHVTIFQGDDMGRPSSILLTIGGSRMKISGTATDLN
ncbi:PhzF family phenazine biosynthesis protein [Aurantimicrobium minutum]|uniref:PhzF family phenazine biosynthesis protein n=1 Tax=Aurantimicrobium minutum TaxID=708131 RepID=UPI0024758317|nr:PhzF family phenazine biosynthesis protein [Aurantimicrobium minutum]MDH6422908.1 PhzF family phenazine biosynthesis protein [Aurantimicrobium minutum]